MPALAPLVDARHRATIDIDAIDVLLDGILGISGEEDVVSFLVKTEHVHHHPVATGQLLDLLAAGEQIEVVVTVLLALHDKRVFVPREEDNGCLRLDILVVRLAIEFGDAVAGLGIITDQAAVVLVAIQFHHVDDVAIGVPGDVGEVAVGGVASIEIDRLTCCQVIDTHRDLVRGLPCHGIFLGSRGGNVACGIGHLRHINQGIVGDHRLVHAIECQACACRIPEQSTHDAELVAVHGLAIDDVARTVGCELSGLPCPISDIEVVALHVGQCPTLLAPLGGLLLATVLTPHLLLGLEVDHLYLAHSAQCSQRLVGVGERDTRERTDSVVAQPLVDLSTSEKHFLLAILEVDSPASVGSNAHQLVAPPAQRAVLWNHVTVVRSAEVQVLERELLLCRHGQHHHHQCGHQSRPNQSIFHHIVL